MHLVPIYHHDTEEAEADLESDEEYVPHPLTPSYS